MNNGRYWDRPWSLVSSCTRCSPGCDHCWALAMEKRFHKGIEGVIKTHPDRLDIPLRRKKPTVYAVWNDLFHEDVPDSFQYEVYKTMIQNKQHTYLVLTKRPHNMARFLSPENCFARPEFPHIWHGATICNQPEADAKIPDLLRVPGKKWLSIEPMLGPVDLSEWLHKMIPWATAGGPNECAHGYAEGIPCPTCNPKLDCIVLGGESGPGARPLYPDWVRSVRDQCIAAGVPYFFKGWGEWVDFLQTDTNFNPTRTNRIWLREDGTQNDHDRNDGISALVHRVGTKRSGRLLDGQEWNELPWRREV